MARVSGISWKDGYPLTQPLSGGAAFGWALLGGLIAEALTIAAHRRTAPEDFPAEYRRLTYWGLTGVMIFIGGFVALLYAGSAGVSLNAILAANIGASPGLAFDRLVKGVPAGPPGSAS